MNDEDLIFLTKKFLSLYFLMTSGLKENILNDKIFSHKDLKEILSLLKITDPFPEPQLPQRIYVACNSKGDVLKEGTYEECKEACPEPPKGTTYPPPSIEMFKPGPLESKAFFVLFKELRPSWEDSLKDWISKFDLDRDRTNE